MERKEMRAMSVERQSIVGVWPRIFRFFFLKKYSDPPTSDVPTFFFNPISPHLYPLFLF